MPRLSKNALNVWNDFLDFHKMRLGPEGPRRITWQDLQARQIATGYALQPWATRAVFRLDDVFMAFHAREANKSRGA